MKRTYENYEIEQTFDFIEESIRNLMDMTKIDCMVFRNTITRVSNEYTNSHIDDEINMSIHLIGKLENMLIHGTHLMDTDRELIRFTTLKDKYNDCVKSL